MKDFLHTNFCSNSSIKIRNGYKIFKFFLIVIQKNHTVTCEDLRPYMPIDIKKGIIIKNKLALMNSSYTENNAISS